MTPEEAFDIWAPRQAIWSPWAKPVLFAHIDPRWDAPPPLMPVPLDWAPPADGKTAMVIDLIGPRAIEVGIALASRGYRPIPLYNATPPSDSELAAVEVGPILDGLIAGAFVLLDSKLPGAAPPVFLLDSTRRFGTGIRPTPGTYDNRSVSLPTDFPSANTLLSNGIERVLLVQETDREPQKDLAHTLLRWQQAGIPIFEEALDDPATHTHRITVRRPSLFRQAWQRMLATAGLRRNPLGGFGGLLPIPSSGGGLG